MKTLVVGTGIIGTTWGWALSNAGINITHLVRPGNIDRYKNGITLDVLDGRKGHKKENVVVYDLKCVESISTSEPYDLIILSVNFNKIDAVLDPLVPLSGDATFLIFGANWFGVEPIEKRLPRERYLLGFPRGGGTKQDDTHYLVAMDPGVFLGEADGRSTEKLQRVESLSVSTYGPGLKRILARLNQTTNEKELREAMLKTAEELKFDMPLLTAAGVGL